MQELNKFNLLGLKVQEKASQDRGVIGGSYEIEFYIEDFEDFITLTADGQIQAKTKDDYHLYLKPWEKSQFSSWNPVDIPEKLFNQIERIRVKGCGNGYLQEFQTYDTFSAWIGTTDELSLFKNKENHLNS